MVFENPFKRFEFPGCYFYETHGLSLDKMITTWRNEFEGLIPPEWDYRFSFDRMMIGRDMLEFHNRVGKDKSWGDFIFRDIPIAAAPVIFRQIEKEIRMTENALLYYFLGIADSYRSYICLYEVTTYPNAKTLYRGESFATNIMLSSTCGPRISNMIKVNGKPVSTLRAYDLFGTFEETASKPGIKTRKVDFALRNQATYDTTIFSNVFEYTVKERNPKLRVEGNNVLYVGKDNRLSLEIPGDYQNDISLKSDGEGLEISRVDKSGKYLYKAIVTEPGSYEITATGKNITTTTFELTAKRLPSPSAAVKGQTSGNIALENFLSADRIELEYLDHAYDLDCTIEEFELLRIDREERGQNILNQGATFNEAVRSLQKKASAEDRYLFHNIYASCNDEAENRRLGDMVFYVE